MRRATCSLVDACVDVLNVTASHGRMNAGTQGRRDAGTQRRRDAPPRQRRAVSRVILLSHHVLPW